MSQSTSSWLWGGDETARGTKPDPGAGFRPPGTASPSLPPREIGNGVSSPQPPTATPPAQKRELHRRTSAGGAPFGGAPFPPPLPAADSTGTASVLKPPPALSLAGCSSMPQLQLRPTGFMQPGRATLPLRSTGKSLQVQDKTSPGQQQEWGDEENRGSSVATVSPLWSTLAGEQLGALSRELADLRQEVLSLKKGASCGLQLKVSGPASVGPRESEPASQPGLDVASVPETDNRHQLAQLTREMVSLRKDVDSVQHACSKCDADVKQAKVFASTSKVRGSPDAKPTNEKLAAVLGEFDRTMKSWLQRRLDEQAREQERREGEQRMAWEAALELRTKSLESSIRNTEEKLTSEVQQLAAEHRTAESVMRDVFVEQCSGVEKSMAKSTLEIREETKRALDKFDVTLRGRSAPVSNEFIPADSRALWNSDLQTVVEALAQLEHEQDSKHAGLRSAIQELDVALRDEIRQSLESHHEVQADAIQQAMNQLVRNLNDAFTMYKNENQTQIDHAVDELVKAKHGFQPTREPQAPEVSGREQTSAVLTISSQSSDPPVVERQSPAGGGTPAVSRSMVLDQGRSSPVVPSRSLPLAAVATPGPAQVSQPSSPAEVQAQLRGASRTSWSGQRAQSLRNA